MSHYYEKTKSGVEARHFVPMSARPKELRPTRITDVRKWWKDGQMVVPSVTTVGNVLDKGALTNWLIEQHLKVAHGSTPGDESAEQWIRRIKGEAEIEMAKAPDAGTDMHTVLEAFFGGTDPEDKLLHQICYAVSDKVDELCGDVSWRTEEYFVDPLGYGGCADLVGDGWVIDYKTKQTADKFKPGKMAYDDHRMQLAAYRMGFGMPAARCANIFICLEDGKIDFHEHSQVDLFNGWEIFRHSLAIWKLRNGWPAEMSGGA